MMFLIGKDVHLNEQTLDEAYITLSLKAVTLREFYLFRPLWDLSLYEKRNKMDNLYYYVY